MFGIGRDQHTSDCALASLPAASAMLTQTPMRDCFFLNDDRRLDRMLSYRPVAV